MYEHRVQSGQGEDARINDSSHLTYDPGVLRSAKHHASAALSTNRASGILNSTLNSPRGFLTPTGNTKGTLPLKRKEIESDEVDSSYHNRKSGATKENNDRSALTGRDIAACNDKQNVDNSAVPAPKRTRNQLNLSNARPAYPSPRAPTNHRSNNPRPIGNLDNSRRSFLDTHDALRVLQRPQNFYDLIRSDPKGLLELTRNTIGQLYEERHPIGNNWLGNLSSKVGDIHQIVIPQIRGDTSPIPLENPQILPGPYDTDIIVKICPVLLISNRGRETDVYKVLTTKHNTDLERPDVRRDLEYNFVQMRRTPEEDNDQTWPCFESLTFRGVPNFAWHSPSFIPVAGYFQYPRRAPRRYLGKLDGESEVSKLLEILEEDGRRFVDFVRRQVVSQSRTRTLPVDPEAEPVPNTSALTARIPEEIDAETVYEYYRTREVSLEDVTEL